MVEEKRAAARDKLLESTTRKECRLLLSNTIAKVCRLESSEDSRKKEAKYIANGKVSIQKRNVETECFEAMSPIDDLWLCTAFEQIEATELVRSLL
jgi:TATA-binding protein-associated factor Taf7